MSREFRIGRSTWLLAVLLLALLAPPGYGQGCPSVGAIRWDAWHGSRGVPGRAVEAALGPERFQARAPFCSRSIAPNRLEIDCTSQSTVDKEIRLAAEAGLDYWAFLAYPEGSPMGAALERYLHSESRSLVRFSVILTPSALSQPPGSLARNLDRFAGYTADANYQKAVGNRPLVFFLPEGGFLDKPEAANWLRDTFAAFRARVKAKGVAEPYLVLMAFDPARGQRVAVETGFDAVSTYATHGNGKGAPYSRLAEEARRYWERAKATGAKVVPTAMAGWDRRPRVLHPMPWEKSQPPRPGEIDYYYESPSPEQLAAHVTEAMDWVRANPQAAEANAVLVYAWNENDEGGWIVPTLGEGDARVRALGARIRQACPTKP